MMLFAFSMVVFMLAFIPCALFLQNLRVYRALPTPGARTPSVSVLIPARDEEANIESVVRSVLAARGVEFEVIVFDDQSSDRTGAIVQRIADKDRRVRLVTGARPPTGWRGKNFACSQLAALARHPLLVFLDADVRVTDTDALARLARFMAESNAALVSGLPCEITRTWLEQLIVPLIHFVLLGFLPLRRMRATTDPRFAAACGQLIAAWRQAYDRSGGHGAVAASLHDGIALARNFRAHGFRTDLFDATDAFSCRMYGSAGAVWRGFVKNAHEGLGAPRLIVPATLLLLGGQVVPFIAAASLCGFPIAAFFVWLAAGCALLPRVIAASRFAQPFTSALLHPLGILLLLAIQWEGLLRQIARRPVTWRGRAESSIS